MVYLDTLSGNFLVQTQEILQNFHVKSHRLRTEI